MALTFACARIHPPTQAVTMHLDSGCIAGGSEPPDSPIKPAADQPLSKSAKARRRKKAARANGSESPGFESPPAPPAAATNRARTSACAVAHGRSRNESASATDTARALACAVHGRSFSESQLLIESSSCSIQAYTPVDAARARPCLFESSIRQLLDQLRDLRELGAERCRRPRAAKPPAAISQEQRAAIDDPAAFTDEQLAALDIDAAA